MIGVFEATTYNSESLVRNAEFNNSSNIPVFQRSPRIPEALLARKSPLVAVTTSGRRPAFHHLQPHPEAATAAAQAQPPEASATVAPRQRIDREFLLQHSRGTKHPGGGQFLNCSSQCMNPIGRNISTAHYPDRPQPNRLPQARNGNSKPDTGFFSDGLSGFP